MVAFCVLTCSVAFCQSNLPSLAETRLAAEHGDHAAQDKLGEIYLGQGNFSSAAEWFRKAAEAGIVNSQSRLGEILLDGKPKLAYGSVAVPKDKDAAIKWFSMAANQGHRGAQINLGNCYERGNGVKQDNVEAYKWFRLSSATNKVIETIYLNRLILRMSPQQIDEAEKRARAFAPHQSSESDFPEPQFARNISLKGIAGTPNHRVAMINNKTLEVGEEAKVKVGEKLVSVRVVEIREKSAGIVIEGMRQPKEISLKP